MNTVPALVHRCIISMHDAIRSTGVTCIGRLTKDPEAHVHTYSTDSVDLVSQKLAGPLKSWTPAAESCMEEPTPCDMQVMETVFKALLPLHQLTGKWTST